MGRLKKNIPLFALYTSLVEMHFDRGIFILYLIHHGLSDHEISALQITLFLIAMLMEFPSGVFADRFGRKTTMIMGVIGLIIYAIGMFFVDDFWLFLLLFCIMATSFAMSSGASNALFYDSLKALKRSDEYVLLNARIRVIATISLTTALTLGGWLQTMAGWAGVYGSYSAMMFLALIVLFWISEPPYENDIEEQNRSYKQKVREAKEALWARKAMLLLMVGFALLWAIEVPFYIYAQKLFDAQGFAITHIGWIYGAAEAVTVLAFFAAPYLLKRFGFDKMTLLIIPTTALLVASLMINQPVWTVLVFVVALNLPMLLIPPYEDYLNRHFPSHVRASLLSFDEMIANFVIALGYVYYAYAQTHLPLAQVIALWATIGIPAFALCFVYFRNEWEALNKHEPINPAE